MKDRLLLVDDDASLLKLLAIRLEAEGFEVLTVESAEAALQSLRNEPVERNGLLYCSRLQFHGGLLQRLGML